MKRKTLCKVELSAKRAELFMLINVIAGIVCGIVLVVSNKNLSWGDKGFFADGFKNFCLGVLIICFLSAALWCLDQVLSASKSVLELQEGRIYGVVKSGLLPWKKNIDIPISKIDTISATYYLSDWIRGGETLKIWSTSCLVRFHLVQNAQSFISMTLTEIDRCHAYAENTDITVEMTIANKIRELNNLLDMNLISQEEYAEKKKELLRKL